jgi:hypothetical protein
MRDHEETRISSLVKKMIERGIPPRGRRGVIDCELARETRENGKILKLWQKVDYLCQKNGVARVNNFLSEATRGKSTEGNHGLLGPVTVRASA